MSFSARWHTLLEHVEAVADGATLLTPLSGKPFRVTDVQEHRVLAAFEERDETRPLQRDQFETLFRRVEDAPDGFALDRLPPDAEPYATVLSLHPRFELDDHEGTLTETETPTGSPLVNALSTGDPADADRTEPELPIYADALLLIDALERYPMDDLNSVETNALVNLYTLLSDVQRNADDLRQSVADVLLDRLHHERPVSGQFGSVQRTSRRRKSLKDDEAVLATLDAAGVDRERVTSVDPSKVDEALNVTDLSESDVYEIEETEYVRKAEVDEDRKDSRLQGLKDRLAGTDEDTEELQAEIEDLEARIEELTSFESGSSFHTRSEG